ncbi:MAG TPA: AbrB/MazE/SpoVT family DNA-binding domain-containing protein [Chromatiales bacterium]|nr:AbrB/MazE/SpoVT family DNA-binding domain-containing protein [Chromatiales bacterium]HEX23162.1 AbrB/MazE/SpoVT family DNA-binding domain-containing protein [Chromatiales bacterium]
MSTATITSKGQITIPKPVRQRLGVNPGDRVEFIELENGVFQLVAASRDIKSLKGIVPKLANPVTIDEMNETIASMGEE